MAAVCANGHAHRFDTPVVILRDEATRVAFVPGERTSQEEDQAAFEAAVSSVPPERLAALAQAEGGGAVTVLPRLFLPVALAEEAEIRALAPAVAALPAARDPQALQGCWPSIPGC